jgi:hypothetical protein
MADERQEARRIIAEVARAVDRRLAVEVRELPGGESSASSSPTGTGTRRSSCR